MQRRFGLVAALLSGLLLSVGSSWAAYPEKAIKWIVPYPPAGTTDVLARIIAQTLSERLGQQVIVENKPGGGNNIGTEFVVNHTGCRLSPYTQCDGGDQQLACEERGRIHCLLQSQPYQGQYGFIWQRHICAFVR